MSKTVKPSWSFPAVSANVADTAHTTMGSLFSFYLSKKHTKFLVCFFVLKLNY